MLVEQHIKFALGFSKHTVVMDRGHVVYSGASAKLRDEKILQKYIGLAA